MYNNCQIFAENYCGKDPSYQNVKCDILDTLNDDVGGKFYENFVIKEKTLIQQRSDVRLDFSKPICPKHRFALGKLWKPSSKCMYEGHPLQSKSKGCPVSVSVYTFLTKKYSSFKLGQKVCKPCAKIIYREMSASDVSDNEHDDKDNDFVPDQLILSDDTITKCRTKMNSITSVLNMAQIDFIISETECKNLSQTSIDYLRNFYKTIQSNLIEVYCQNVAPGQSEEFKKILLADEKADSMILSDDLKNLIEVYQRCTTKKSKVGVLTIIPKEYTKKFICHHFKCTSYEITLARQIVAQYGPLAEKPSIPRVYNRLSKDKAIHFIRFLMYNGILQEVAFGTTKLKLSDGTKIVVSDTILNGLKQTAINEYILYCNEIQYPSLCQSSLRTILNKIKPRQRKKIGGVDGFIVDGVEAFQVSFSCIYSTISL